MGGRLYWGGNIIGSHFQSETMSGHIVALPFRVRPLNGPYMAISESETLLYYHPNKVAPHE